MMCMVLGHSHPELTETIKEMAGTFVHQSSWYSNPWTVEFAERLTEHTPGNLKVVNFAVTGSEANEIAMRMALAYTGKFDIVSMIRGLHGGSLAVEALTSVGGNRKQGPWAAACSRRQVECAAAALLLSLPGQPEISLLRHRLPQVERGDA